MIPPVGSATQYVPVEDPKLEANQFFSFWEHSYQEGDFVCPLFQLMRRSCLKDGLSSAQKREWVESMHQDMVTRSYSDDFQKFALEAGPVLIDLFLNTATRNSIYLRNSLIFYSLIRIKDDFSLDIEFFVKAVSDKTANGIEMIEAINETKFRYFRDEKVDDLCTRAIENAKWEREKKEFYRKIFPFVLTQMEEAHHRGVQFHEQYVPVEPCCCNII